MVHTVYYGNKYKIKNLTLIPQEWINFYPRDMFIGAELNWNKK